MFYSFLSSYYKEKGVSRSVTQSSPTLKKTPPKRSMVPPEGGGRPLCHWRRCSSYPDSSLYLLQQLL